MIGLYFMGYDNVVAFIIWNWGITELDILQNCKKKTIKWNEIQYTCILYNVHVSNVLLHPQNPELSNRQMVEPIMHFMIVLRNHNKSRWANQSRRRYGVKLRGLLFTLPLESLCEKKGSQDKADHVVLVESSDWPKPQRRRSDGGGVGSLEWHNYNKFELATRGKFETLLNNNLNR